VILLLAFAALGLSSDDPTFGFFFYLAFFTATFALVYLYIKKHQRRTEIDPPIRSIPKSLGSVDPARPPPVPKRRILRRTIISQIKPPGLSPKQLRCHPDMQPPKPEIPPTPHHPRDSLSSPQWPVVLPERIG
jgi:hypothetical protein